MKAFEQGLIANFLMFNTKSNRLQGFGASFTEEWMAATTGVAA